MTRFVSCGAVMQCCLSPVPRQKCRPGRLFCKINQLLLSRNHNLVVQHILALVVKWEMDAKNTFVDDSMFETSDL